MASIDIHLKSGGTPPTSEPSTPTAEATTSLGTYEGVNVHLKNQSTSSTGGHEAKAVVSSTLTEKEEHQSTRGGSKNRCGPPSSPESGSANLSPMNGGEEGEESSPVKSPKVKPPPPLVRSCLAHSNNGNHYQNGNGKGNSNNRQEEASSAEETDDEESGVAAVVKKKVVTFLSPYRSPQRGVKNGGGASGGRDQDRTEQIGFPQSANDETSSPARGGRGSAAEASTAAAAGSQSDTILGKIINSCFPPDGTDHHLQQSLTMSELLPPVIPRAMAIYVLRVLLVWLLKKLIFSKLHVSSPKEASAKALQHALFALSFVNAFVSSVFGLTYTKKLEKLETTAAASSATAAAVATKEGGSTTTYNTVPKFDSRKEAKQYDRVMRVTRQIVYMIFSYIVHDLLTILPDWRSAGADVIHHFVGIGVSVSLLRRPLTMLPMVAPITHLEVSTVPLNVMWILRDVSKYLPAGGTASKIVENVSLLNQVIFAATFFWFRVAWYPLYFWGVRAKRPDVWERTIGPSGRKLLVAQYGLHLYWFSLVFKKLLATLSKRK